LADCGKIIEARQEFDVYRSRVNCSASIVPHLSFGVQ
jgi:hypothetical protein